MDAEVDDLTEKNLEFIYNASKALENCEGCRWPFKTFEVCDLMLAPAIAIMLSCYRSCVIIT